MKKIGKNILLIFLFQIISLFAYAKVDVQAVVNQNEAAVGEALTLTVSVASEESVEVGEPHLPSLDGFKLVNTWNSSSTSSQLMQSNGSMQFKTIRKQEINYNIVPVKKGKLQIPAITLLVDGKTYATKPILVDVGEHSTSVHKNQNSQLPGLPSFDDIDEADQMFEQLLQRHSSPAGPPPANKIIEHNKNESFFIQVETDKVSAFEGEQITANWYLYTRGNILSLDRLKFPDLKGFWKEIIEEVPALNFQEEIVNGVVYRKALLASHALFPIKAGVSVIDEYKVKCTVQVPQGAFGLGPAYTYTRSSDRVKIDVKPLPLEGRGENFSGAVGKFKMTTTVDGESFPANQPFSLKIRFDGAGNAKTIELPNLQLPPGLEIYDTKKESKFFKNGQSYKEFEVLIIPRQEGDFTIPSFSTNLFDPQSKKYYTQASNSFKIKITPATTVQNSSSRLQVNEPVKINSNQLPDLLLSPDIAKESSNYSNKSILLVLAVIVFIVLLYKGKIELVGTKAKSLRADYQKKLKKVQQIVDSGDWRKAGTEISNLIYYVLGSIAGQRGANQELSKLLNLAPPSIRQEVGDELTKHIELFQIIGFAPEAVVGKYQEKSELKRVLNLATQTLEKAISLSEKESI